MAKTTIKNPKSAHSWFLTLNNPHKYYAWAEGFDYEKATAKDYRSLCDAAANLWMKGKGEEINGAIACFEVGKGTTDGETGEQRPGTPHMHVLLCSKNPIRFEQVKKSFPHAHIEPVYGTVDEVVDYMYKRGSYE